MMTSYQTLPKKDILKMQFFYLAMIGLCIFAFSRFPSAATDAAFLIVGAVALLVRLVVILMISRFNKLRLLLIDDSLLVLKRQEVVRTNLLLTAIGAVIMGAGFDLLYGLLFALVGMAFSAADQWRVFKDGKPLNF